MTNNHRIIKLTEAGEALFHYAKQITVMEQELHEIMDDFQQLKKGAHFARLYIHPSNVHPAARPWLVQREVSRH